MLGLIRQVRPGERSLVARAFVVLLALLFSHTVLETGRDALFLVRASADQLPLVYLGTAVAALWIARQQTRSSRSPKHRLGRTSWGVAIGTVGLGALASTGSDAAVYLLYVWSGVATSTTLVHLFHLLGSALSITQAKRVFPVIGLGSILGALLGSATASELSRILPPVGLVQVAGLGFVGAALAIGLLPDGDAKAQPDSVGFAASLRQLADEPYSRRVGIIVVSSAATLTVADYLFKSLVEVSVAPENLGVFLGRTYLVINALALLSQVGLVTWILRRFDLIVGICTLPALLMGSALGAWWVAGIAAALMLKTPEGTLKHSLYRTSMELLYVPLDPDQRVRVKTVLDLLGQRAGQSLGSAALLVWGLAWPEGTPFLLVLLAATWIGAALNLRVHYLDLFRRRLRRGFGGFQRPPLNLEGLETIYAGLDSDDPHTVSAALQLLEREGRARVVPGLILYHPEPEVVANALDLFSRTGRTRSAELVGRCFTHPAPAVREAAVGAWVRLTGRPVPTAAFTNETSPEVEAALHVARLFTGEQPEAQSEKQPSTAVRAAMARAAGRTGGPASLIATLLEDSESSVRLAAARAAEASPSEALVEPLIPCLRDESLRAAAVAGLKGVAERAQATLERSLLNGTRPGGDGDISALAEVPMALAEVAPHPERASRALLEAYVRAQSGLLRYRILLALGSMLRAYGELELEAEDLDRAIHATVGRALRYVNRRLHLDRGGEALASRRTEGHGLIRETLSSKLENTVVRLLQLLALRYPHADFRSIQVGLRSDQKEDRAGALELLEAALKPPLRAAVLALVDERPDAEVLRESAGLHPSFDMDYAGLLTHMLESPSALMQDLVAFHVAELGWTEFIPHLEGCRARRPESLDVVRALDQLRAEAPRP